MQAKHQRTQKEKNVKNNDGYGGRMSLSEDAGRRMGEEGGRVGLGGDRDDQYLKGINLKFF